MIDMTVKEIVNTWRPVQVMFYDGAGMCSGIMLGSRIICACCGAIFDVDEVVGMAREDGVEAIKMFTYWVDLSDEIRGDGINNDYLLHNIVTLETEDC